MPNNIANPIPAPGSHPELGDYARLTGKAKIQCAAPGLISLGYDDGVNEKNDDALMRLLEQEGVVATFYVNGFNMNDITLPRSATILKKLKASRHQIACKF
jgi:peptidoglycan/xylan/chitin deacetylase (PgdA/CDA1 family)